MRRSREKWGGEERWLHFQMSTTVKANCNDVIIRGEENWGEVDRSSENWGREVSEK